MAPDLLGRIGSFLGKRRPWYELPRLLSMPRLVEIRNELREKNLHDTEEPPLERKEIPADLDPELRHERTVDGTYNDLALSGDGQLRPAVRPQRPARTHVPGHGQPARLPTRAWSAAS